MLDVSKVFVEAVGIVKMFFSIFSISLVVTQVLPPPIEMNFFRLPRNQTPSCVRVIGDVVINILKI